MGPNRGVSRNLSRSPDSLFVSEARPTEGPRGLKLPRNDGIMDEPTTDTLLEQLDDDFVPGYKASQEPRPRRAIYHESFKEAEKNCQIACDLFLVKYNMLKEEGYVNEEIDNVCSEFGQLTKCRLASALYPEVGAVAVLGPAGSGKSSAMNSVLSSKKVAFEHDGDERGTYVVHEYAAPHLNQTAKYHVTVPYYGEDEIKRDIIRHVRDIKLHLFESEEDKSEAGQEDDDYQALQQKYETALDFFTDLLCHQKQFQTTEATRQFFDQNVEKDGDELLLELAEHVQDLLDRRNLVNGEECFTAETETELHAILKTLRRPTKAGKHGREPSPWPVIHKVVVRQSIPLLAAGVRLADTPGINDANLTVVGNTTRYLKKAGTILVFLSYKRITANSPLEKLLRDCIALGKMHGTRLVITMIDEMKRFSDDEKEDLDEDDRSALEKVESKLQKVKLQIKNTSIAKQRARGTDNDRYAELDVKLQSLEQARSKASAALQQVAVEIRCSNIRKKLKNSLKNIERSKRAPELPITFVSNIEYQKHVDGYSPTDPPSLDIERTGIPALRRILFEVPSYGKLSNLSGLIKNRLPNALHGINGILTTSKLERKDEVRAIIVTELGKVTGPVKRHKEDISSVFESTVAHAIDDNIDDWQESAESLLAKWAVWNSATFFGVCRRMGVWEGHKKHSDINWNADFLDIYSRKLILAFNKLDECIDGIEKDFSLDVADLLHALRDQVESSPAASGQNLTAFFLFVGGVIREVQSGIELQFKSLRSNIARIRHAATLDIEDSLVTNAMKKTYDACALANTKTAMPFNAADSPVVLHSGKKRRRRRVRESVHATRIQIIRRKIRGEGVSGLFDTVKDLAETNLEKDLDLWEGDCNLIMQLGHEKILADFDRRYADDKSEVKKEQNPEAVRQLQEALKSAWSMVDGPLKQQLEELEAFDEDGSA